MGRAGERPRRLPAPTAAVAGVVAILFVGGVVVGWARSARLPGPYLVAADSRSVEREGRTAARWAREHLEPGNRIITDRANALLQGSIGLQEPQDGVIRDRYVQEAITTFPFQEYLRIDLDDNGIAYLVVDRRLSTGLPEVGVYFERSEPNAYAHTEPLAEEALLKYDAVCPAGRSYDSGNIVIYDVRAIRFPEGCPADPEGSG